MVLSKNSFQFLRAEPVSSRLREEIKSRPDDDYDDDFDIDLPETSEEVESVNLAYS